MQADCSGSTTVQLAGDLDADNAYLEARYAEIEALISNKSAGRESQCQTMALGVKPCGGAWEYIVFSTKQTDTEELENMVCGYNAYQEAMNEEYGLFSDCAVVGPPNVVLVDGECTTE